MDPINNSSSPAPAPAPAPTDHSRAFSNTGSPLDGGHNPFAPAPQQYAQPQPGNRSGLPNDPNPPAAQPRGYDAGGYPNNGAPQESANPLDKYLPKRDTAPNGPAPSNNGVVQPQQQQEQQMNPWDFQAQSYQEILGRSNHVGEITPEMMASIQQGDVAVLAKLINNAVVSASSNAAFLAAQVSRKGVEQQFDGFTKSKLPDILKSHETDQAWSSNSKTDILRHPAVESMARAKIQELAQQFPEASPAELQQTARAYFKDFASALMNSEKSQDDNSQSKPSKLAQFFNG